MPEKQIFQTSKKSRWITFQWVTRMLLIVFLIASACVAYTLLSNHYPNLPIINSTATLSKKEIEQIKKSKTYSDFRISKKRLLQIQHNQKLHRLSHPNNKARINAGFYVNWDPQSLTDLKDHIKQLDMVVTESFFIKNGADTVIDQVSTEAMKVIHKHKKVAIAMVSNFSGDHFDGNAIHKLLQNKGLQNRFIDNLIKSLKKYGFHGVNIDFEEIKEKTDEPLAAFQKNLYEKLHAQNLIVSQDISPDNDDYNLSILEKYNDYVFIMAYDQHSESSNAGDISHQQWVEEQLDKICERISSDKVILALACYGFDWPDQDVGKTVTYQQAIANANRYNGKIKYDPISANLNYNYTDESGLHHQVFFTDAATNFNLIRKADDWDVAGIAIWRIGAEDPRLWTFISKDLSLDSVRKSGVDLKRLTHIGLNDRIDYSGDGEILDLVSVPKQGKIDVKLDTTNFVISDQTYVDLPTKYSIRRYGHAEKKIVLTFDDGPDPVYTPQIIDILQREKVPGSFFVVGIMAEQNMGLLLKEFKLGYEIGNHTFFHPDMSKVGKERVNFELNATRKLIESVTGHSTILFRPPFNADAEPSTSAEILPVAQSRDQNYINIGESIDPQDWQPGITADQIFDAVVKQQDLGNILLLHDAGGNRAATVEALPRIIKHFKDKGYEFVTIGNLIGKKKDELMPPVNSGANSFITSGNTLFLNVFSYGTLILNYVFIMAIILAMLRSIFIAILAVKQKRASKKDSLLLLKDPDMRVSIIIPAYNEEVTVVQTLNSLLKTSYKNADFIFVDDGSKDRTVELVNEHFAHLPNIKIYTKPNGGKASALNFGIALSEADFVICIDADTQLKTDAITELMRYFYEDEIAAVAGTVKVGNKTNLITNWQSIEYITAQNMDRRAFDILNTITVVPGAIGAFRKQVIQEVGGFTTDTLAEDCDLTMRILRAGYTVRNCDTAIAYTEAPETVNMLLKQRLRWSFGVMQSFWKNKSTLFNKKYGYFGMVGMPNILVYQIILPLFSPLADFFMLLSIITGLFSLSSVNSLTLQGMGSLLSLDNGFGQVFFFYCLFILVDLFFAGIAFRMEKEPYKKLIYIIPQRFYWRQLMYLVLFRSVRKALKGELEGWGVLKRTGNVKEQN
ncbi:glycosyltransferase [Pedobacter cryoconitis]|uniref:Cellulose synthase/poly-beta-1,6-N-acetylglucosamine synthase-like glycosyltransferase/spore germination protein YaaH/peptidoglycan/xylan/chitin deacetylase (PgdA/CDA1 family) n=1 Tax=Pedobacter cryoconitis TaxID=188932 RepID=A0A7X0J2S7_9SPHI|nr:glycosyltransferase [Pedobacter cryoconitis]MBB6498566.1 cellulose synthase/poly-beta-1,6-N-acetylglucosamine synthase-like glycosyltransferase/spore germination protein YaaH/peptidoglycan/xylan/chitin deacetylase (PgdA/CDA1 family) [Pedobacter cryoconitis]